jgi:glycosyltransferase involved in cell wall biosynthesis
MGWQWVQAISRYHDLWILTEKDEFQAEVEAGLAECPELAERTRFFFIRKNRHRTLRKIWPPSFYWFYGRWHRDAYELARRLHAEVKFDVIHQLNMVGFREPGHLWKLDAPFVWGPVGGLGTMPWRFLSVLGCYGAVYHLAKDIINISQRRLLPRPKKAARAARGALIAATGGTQRAMSRFFGEESTVITEVGPVSKPRPEPLLAREAQSPIRIVWNGLHIPRKALPLILRAVSTLGPEVAWELHILGDGPRRAAWRRLALRLGLENRCHWYGWLPREQAIGVMQSGHVFVITSLADLTSTVLLEALSLGLPIVCLDHCGFSDVVTEECGIKVPVGSPGQVEHDLAAAITGLWRDEGHRRCLAAGAIARAGEFSWEAKARALDAIYRRAVENGRRST